MKWNEDVKIVEEQIRAAGCISIVDVENGRLFIWPVAKCPRACQLQLMLNDKKLGRALCKDLLSYAGYCPDETV